RNWRDQVRESGRRIVTAFDIAASASRPSAILLALFFTALSFLSLIFYDLNAIEYIGKKLHFPHVALTAFSAYAVGNTAGLGALS
ncbi:hypothetical protein ACCS91_39250, partial [Rhizobium ruizarguesonis]